MTNVDFVYYHQVNDLISYIRLKNYLKNKEIFEGSKMFIVEGYPPQEIEYMELK